MGSIFVREIAVDQSGRLLVKPESPSASFQYIYRAANGLRWDDDSNAFVAAEPQRWNATELLAHLEQTLRDELGASLRLTSETSWVNLSSEQQTELRGVLTGSSNAV